MEKLKGFMIMPFFSLDETKEINIKGLGNCADSIVKKKLCENFYKKIIKPKCRSLNIEINRADEILKSRDVVDNIISHIEQSDIIIVDLTLNRPNVLYELGIAHYIDPERTLLITQENFDDLPFDIQGYSCLKYESTDVDFAESLYENLVGLVEHHYENEISIGIPPFPELTILNKELKDKKINIVTKSVPWNETFDHFLDGKRIDFVIANFDLCNKKNSIKRSFDFIYRADLIKYNSFYLIAKNTKLKSFNELSKEIINTKECLLNTMSQFNLQNKKTILYACEKSDHAESFRKFNSIFKDDLIKSYEIRGQGSSREILRDFIMSRDADLYIGGIPERINLLKNGNYKLIIDFNEIKHDEDFNKIKDELHQTNGIVYHRSKEREIDNLDNILLSIQSAWNDAYSNIINAKENNIDLINEYLDEYNNSEYVRTFNFRNVKLTVNSKEFIENYLEGNLITIDHD